MADCQTCELEKRTGKLERIVENQEVRIKDLERDVSKNSAERKNFYNKFNELELGNQKHDMEIKNIFEKLDSICEKTDDIDRKVDEINSRPAKNMGQFTSAVISALGSAFGTGMIAFIIYALSQTM